MTAAVDTALADAEAHDVKRLYKKARCGGLRHFTAVDSSCEAPEATLDKLNARFGSCRARRLSPQAAQGPHHRAKCALAGAPRRTT